MRRRRYLGLAGAALTGGCLRLTEPSDTPTATESPDATGETVTETADATGTPAQTDTPAGTETPSPVGEITGTWAQYGYDAANSGAAPEEAGPTGTVTERWRQSTPQTTTASPVVAGGRAYFTSAIDETSLLWATDATTGEVAWRQPVKEAHNHTPVVADGTVFVTASEPGTVTALDTATGAYRWQASVNAQFPEWGQPTVANGTVYVADRKGTVAALGTSDGSERWRTALDGRCLSGVAVADGQVFATTFGPTAESAYPDGTEPYHFFGGYLDKEPVPSLLEMDASGTVHSLSTSDGSVQWQTELPDFTVATPAVASGTVYVGCWDGGLYALSTTDGSQQWRHAVDTPISGSASIADGTVYVGGWDSVLYAIRTDGSRRWIFPAARGSKITSKPAVADGMVYVSVDDGPVTAISTQGRRAWTFEGSVGDFDQSSPAVADGALFVCGDTGRKTVDGEQQDVGGLYMLA